MTLLLEQSYIDDMIAHAREDAPDECCGIIAGAGGRAKKLYRIRNSEMSPYRFKMHPLDYRNADDDMTEQGWEVLSIYHSHLKTEARPSATDIRFARWPGSDPPRDMFPGVHYVLVSLMDEDRPSVRAFLIEDGVVTEEAIEVAVDG